MTNENVKSVRRKIIWITIVLFVLIAIIWIKCSFHRAFYPIFHDDPYNESHASLIVSRIEKNFNFNFPEKMGSLQAADAVTAGIDRPYVMVVRFITDQNGFDKLKQIADLKDVTEEIAKGEWVDPRMLTELTPQWYKKPIENGRTYEDFLVSDNNKLRLSIICVESNSPQNINVYMGGCGSSRNGKYCE